jgi:hypothetical protein
MLLITGVLTSVAALSLPRRGASIAVAPAPAPALVAEP